MGNQNSHRKESKSFSITGENLSNEDLKRRPFSGSFPVTKNELESAQKSELFILRQTGLSLSEIEEIFQKYIKINPQGGELNKKEFAELYKLIRNEDCKNLACLTDYIFTSFDTDHNGTISFEEFLIGYSFTTRRGLEKKLEYAFNMFDQDGDGFLCKTEVKQVLTGMISLFGLIGDAYNLDDLTKCCFGLMNKKCDGLISKSEFIECLKNDYGLRSLMCPFQ